MPCPQVKRDSGSFMVAGNNINWNSTFCNSHQWSHGHLYKRWRDLTSKEKISTVDDHIKLTSKSWLQRSFEIGKKVMPSSPALDPRAARQIESQMGIGEE